MLQSREYIHHESLSGLKLKSPEPRPGQLRVRVQTVQDLDLLRPKFSNYQLVAMANLSRAVNS